ncbi:MAG: alcohol dehydrogenase catalytic domain-containing protein [Deltaproteobacteria bacterium]|nr:alcohol dehydrogenase catalytic domain-containing protein [Deltaproteobacteria bacterium]
MKALCHKNKKICIEEKPVPAPKETESLIKVTLAGVCNTDIEIVKGYMGFEGTLGHEFVGVVEKSSDTSLIGKRVVSDINCACGECETCRRGHPHHCPHREVIGIVKKDGAFATYITAPTKNLVVVPDTCPDQIAVFAEPVAAALEIQEQVKLKQDEAICVLGDGKLGLIIAMTLANAGFDVTLVGHHPERLSRLGQNMVNYATQALDQIFTTVIEATGNPQGLITAQKIVLPKGKIILNSTYHEGFNFNPALIVINEIEITGSRCGPIDKAVALLSSGEVDPSTLIDKTYPLSEGVQAIAKATEKGVLKVLLDTTQ